MDDWGKDMWNLKGFPDLDELSAANGADEMITITIDGETLEVSVMGVIDETSGVELPYPPKSFDPSNDAFCLALLEDEVNSRILLLAVCADENAAVAYESDYDTWALYERLAT